MLSVVPCERSTRVAGAVSRQFSCPLQPTPEPAMSSNDFAAGAAVYSNQINCLDTAPDIRHRILTVAGSELGLSSDLPTLSGNAAGLEFSAVPLSCSRLVRNVYF
jgi:hypothetical protein